MRLGRRRQCGGDACGKPMRNLPLHAGSTVIIRGAGGEGSRNAFLHAINLANCATHQSDASSGNKCPPGYQEI
jgi:hypothetical protein